MPQRTPLTRRSIYRRSVRLLAATALIAATCFAIFASGTPGAAEAKPGNGGGSGLPDDVEDMKEAFENYLKSIETVTKMFTEADAFTLDPAHSVGAYDLLVAFIQGSGRNSLTSSGAGLRNYPRFAGFDDPDTRIGVDNPDTQYMGTIVPNADCEGVWKIWGERTNTADFILTTFDTTTGTGGGPTLEDEDMTFYGDNNSFVAYASCPDNRDPAWENWLELIASPALQIARRQSMCDWENEAPGPIHIERVGSAGVPSGPLDPTVMTAQIEAGIALFETQGPFWPAFVDSIKNNIPVNTATPWRPTGGLGITTQLSMLAWFELGDDEALIIRLPDSDPRIAGQVAGYYGLEIANFWGSSADWANRHVSMNWGLDGTCQGELSQATFHPAQQLISANGGPFCGQQDAYFIVLSKQDPGLQNWVETAELSQGVIAARLQSINPAEAPNIVGLGSCMLPISIKVPVAFVKPTLQQLGASFTDFDTADRSDQLEVRQNFARDKYIFW